MSQFVTLPPIDRVACLFLHVTGCYLEVDASWKTWNAILPESYIWLKPYIRPCHQKILSETITGKQPTPLALLRQLLRPYDYHIKTMSVFWKLTYGKLEKGVRITKLLTCIVWNDSSPTAELKKE